MNQDKAKNALNKVAILVSVLAIAALLFAAWFSIQFAKSKTKIAFDKRQVYFNAIYSNFNLDWSSNALWDNGYREHNSYLYSRIVNAKTISSEVNLSIGKELFNDQFNVQTESKERPDVYEVMKLTFNSTSINSPEVAQIASTSFFLRKNPLALHKMTISAVDSIGNSFKSWMNTKSILTMNYDSYHDYEGIGKKVFSKDLFLEDQLIYSLRALNFSDTLQFKADVLESQLSTYVGKLTIYHASFTVSKTLNNTWQVSVIMDDKKMNNYFFDAVYPNQLVKMTTWDGQNLTLIKK